MGNYHIKDFEAISGIKAHTIRIWEQRYGLLKPTRSETNIRQYGDDELTLLLNISMLNRNGFKISRVAKMSRAEIEQKVRSITTTNLEHANQVDALTITMLELDENEFDRVLSVNIAQLGFEEAMEQVVFPFLRNLGILWQTGTINPAQEHFISNLIRQKLIVAIDRINVAKKEAISRSLLFLPEGEMHELGLLYLNYLLHKNHHQVMYLGQNVPLRDVEKVVDIFKPDQVFSIFTSFPAASRITGYIADLSKIMPGAQIYLSGYAFQLYAAKVPKNVALIKEMVDIRTMINSKLGLILNTSEK
jgi:DNA-binding transcriptional MerR regulator